MAAIYRCYPALAEMHWVNRLLRQWTAYVNDDMATAEQYGDYENINTNDTNTPLLAMVISLDYLTIWRPFSSVTSSLFTVTDLRSRTRVVYVKLGQAELEMSAEQQRGIFSMQLHSSV